MMQSLGNSNNNKDNELKAAAVQEAIKEQFYRALFDRLWAFLCEQYEAQFWFTGRAALAQLKRDYLIQGSALGRANFIIEKISQNPLNTSRFSSFCASIKDIIKASGDEQKGKIFSLKSYENAKQSIEIVKIPSELSVIVKSVLNVYATRISDCRLLAGKSTALEATYKDWFSSVSHHSSENTNENTKKLVVITRVTEPVIQTPKNQAPQLPISFSQQVIKKLAELFNINHLETSEDPLTREKLLGYLKKDKTYRFGKWGSVFGDHVFGSKYGALEKLLDTVDKLDKSAVLPEERQKLIEDAKRSLKRLKARYPEKSTVSFEEFLLRLDYPATKEEKAYTEQVNKEEEFLQGYISLWKEAHLNGQSFDLDNLPKGIEVPTIDKIEQLIISNNKIDKTALSEKKYKSMLTMLAPLYTYSKSLYYVVLQAYVLALSKKISIVPVMGRVNQLSLRELLNSLRSKINTSTIIGPINYTSEVLLSWPSINLQSLQGKELPVNIHEILSESSLQKIFSSPSKIRSPEVKKSAWPEFEKSKNQIIGESRNFDRLDEIAVSGILASKVKFSDQPELALFVGLISWFLQASQRFKLKINQKGQGNWYSLLADVGADLSVGIFKPQKIESLLYYSSKELHDSDQRLLMQLVKLYPAVKLYHKQIAEICFHQEILLGKTQSDWEVYSGSVQKFVNLNVGASDSILLDVLGGIKEKFNGESVNVKIISASIFCRYFVRKMLLDKVEEKTIAQMRSLKEFFDSLLSQQISMLEFTEEKKKELSSAVVSLSEHLPKNIQDFLNIAIKEIQVAALHMPENNRVVLKQNQPNDELKICKPVNLELDVKNKENRQSSQPTVFLPKALNEGTVSSVGLFHQHAWNIAPISTSACSMIKDIFMSTRMAHVASKYMPEDLFARVDKSFFQTFASEPAVEATGALVAWYILQWFVEVTKKSESSLVAPIIKEVQTGLQLFSKNPQKKFLDRLECINDLPLEDSKGNSSLLLKALKNTILQYISKIYPGSSLGLSNKK